MEMTEAVQTPRKLNVAIIGLGDIGKKLLEMLKIHGEDIGHISVFNRTNLENDTTTRQFIAQQLGTDQSSIALNRYKPENEKTVSFHYGDNEEGLDKALANADLVIDIAGVARRTGQSRSDLLKDNAAIQKKYAPALSRWYKEHPDGTIINVANPVDAMGSYISEVTGIPHERIVGLSSWLDEARLIQSIAFTLNIPHRNIRNAETFGQHGDTMVVAASNIEVSLNEGKTWIPLIEAVTPEQLEKIKEATVKGGGKYTELNTVKNEAGEVIQKGKSDYFGPAGAVKGMVDRYIARTLHGAEPIIVRNSVYSEEHGCSFGQNCSFNPDGTLKIHPMSKLSDEEQKQLDKSIAECQKIEAELHAIMSIQEFAKKEGKYVRGVKQGDNFVIQALTGDKDQLIKDMVTLGIDENTISHKSGCITITPQADNDNNKKVEQIVTGFMAMAGKELGNNTAMRR